MLTTCGAGDPRNSRGEVLGDWVAGEHSQVEQDKCLPPSSPKIFLPNPPVAGSVMQEGPELAVSNFVTGTQRNVRKGQETPPVPQEQQGGQEEKLGLGAGAQRLAQNPTARGHSACSPRKE